MCASSKVSLKTTDSVAYTRNDPDCPQGRVIPLLSPRALGVEVYARPSLFVIA